MAPQESNEITFKDPEQALYDSWQKQAEEKAQQNLIQEPHSHPGDTNIQITPYRGQRKTEYHIMDFLNPEPTTKAQQRQEEIALGIYKKEEK